MIIQTQNLQREYGGRNTHFNFDNMCEDCNWEEQKKNFLCLLQKEETVDLETFKKFEKNLVAAIIDIDIYYCRYLQREGIGT